MAPNFQTASKRGKCIDFEASTSQHLRALTLDKMRGVRQILIARSKQIALVCVGERAKKNDFAFRSEMGRPLHRHEQIQPKYKTHNVST